MTHDLPTLMRQNGVLERIGRGTITGFQETFPCALIEGTYDNGQAEHEYLTIVFSSDAVRRISGFGRKLENSMFWETNNYFPISPRWLAQPRGNRIIITNELREVGMCYSISMSKSRVQMECLNERDVLELNCYLR